jgi:hypothetical protein
MTRARDTPERGSRRSDERPRREAPRPEPGNVLALQRGAGNHAVASLLAGRQLVQRSIPPGAKAGQMVKHTASGKRYTITKAEVVKELGDWGYTVEDDAHRFLIPASTRDYELVEPKEQLLAIGEDPNADFAQAVMAADAEKLNALVTNAQFLGTMRTKLTAERFGLLAAAILLISRHAPAARAEALRVLAIMYGDKGTAFRMLTKPFRTVIVPRNKQMTELDEFKSLLTNDSGRGPGRTFDGRWWAHTRGVGDVVADGKHYAAITEENLLGGAPDATVFAAPRGPAGTPGTAGDVAGGYTPGYSTTTHEMAHAIHRHGLRADQKAVITSAYRKKRAASATAATIGTVQWSDGPRVNPTAPAIWSLFGLDNAAYLAALASMRDDARRPYENYSSQSEEEYFAQAANAYVGTNTGSDTTTGQPRNNGKAWVQANEPDLLALLDELFKGKLINELEADGKLKAGGTCTNPPLPPPPAPAPPPRAPAAAGAGGP